MPSLYELSRKTDEKEKKTKKEPTVLTSISNTVAHVAIFKPDAGLQKTERKRMEWGEKSSY